MLCRLIRVANVAFLLFVSFAGTSASAIGYWNVPGNVAQWWGYGWGAGYHACLVLGPVSHKGAFAHRHVRLPHAPQPPYGCYDGCTYNFDFRQTHPSAPDEYQPLPYGNSTFSTPASVPDALAPDTLPMPAAPAAPEVIFSAPVEP